MDIDDIEEQVNEAVLNVESLSDAKTTSKRGKRVAIDDEHPFDLDAFLSNYTGSYNGLYHHLTDNDLIIGRMTIHRLLHIAKHAPTLAPSALQLAIQYILQTSNTTLYVSTLQEYNSLPSVEHIPVQQKWLDSTNAKNSSEKNRLDVELKQYTSNLIKESIRMGYRELGEYFMTVGDFNQALKNYTKSREYCTTAQHVIDMCLSILQLLIEQRNYTHIATYVYKAEAALDSYSSKNDQSSKSSIPNKDSIQIKLELATALGHLGQSNYDKAAYGFLKLGSFKNFGDWLGTLVAPNDIAIYGTLCALASLSRSAIRSALVENTSFGVYIEQESYIRELIDAYMSSNFKTVLQILERQSDLTSLIRDRAIVLYFQPFESIRLTRMGEAFGMTVEEMEKHLVRLIQAGDIKARIDSQNKILLARGQDPRTAMFIKAIQTGVGIQESNRKLLLRMKLMQADLVVKSPKSNAVQRHEAAVHEMLLEYSVVQSKVSKRTQKFPKQAQKAETYHDRLVGGRESQLAIMNDPLLFDNLRDVTVTIALSLSAKVAFWIFHLYYFPDVLKFKYLMELEEVSSSSSRGGTPEIDRSAILTPAITSVISALGGQQGGKYVLGDEAYGCLKDLKKFWRKDDTDDERTVARIFWKARVLQNDLVPILLETAGKGNVEDKSAIICAELITSMTWPIDMAAELKELDEVIDAKTDFTALLSSHLSYKAALLQPGVLQAIFGIMLPCLAKTRKERTERDGQIINIVLHLFRNLAFVRDLPPVSTQSVDQAEYSNLQSKLIITLSKAHILDALITLAVNEEHDPLFTTWNTVLLETFYLLFRAVQPASLHGTVSKINGNNLTELLATEEKRKRLVQRNAASRHSRFGTTISVKANQGLQPMILHSQEAIKKEARDIIDATKKAKYKKTRTLDELGSQDNLDPEALAILQGVAREFIEFCFNRKLIALIIKYHTEMSPAFLSSLLKDIRSERPKITEKDNLRLLFVTKWFLEFFLLFSPQDGTKDNGSAWVADFQMVAEVVDRGWIVWILRRMRGALDEKPKQWVELQASIECLTQLLLLIDAMSSVSDPNLSEAAEVLQHQLYYNGEVLDLAYDGLLGYKEQSVAYLDSAVHLAYVLLRMLEKWGKQKGDVYVRRRRTRAKNRRQRKGVSEGEGVIDIEEVEEVVQPEDMIEEQMFTFDKFEAKFASDDITRTLLAYLSRFKELSEDKMKRVVSLIHRQAIKAKAEGLFFKVSTLDLFRNILAEKEMFPRTQPHKDLVQLINYILRQFFKAVEKEPFLIVEAFFPKNRGQWKPYSSWEPDAGGKRGKKPVEESLSKHPPDVQIKRGHSWSGQVGIAIACLIETDKKTLIDWAKEILAIVIGIRQRIIEQTDHDESDSDENNEADEEERMRLKAAKLQKPSLDALAKFEDYLIPYVNDQQAEAATKNPHFKLLCRLIKFCVLDDNADELEWYVPAALLPSDLSDSLSVINQFLENPIDLNGKKSSQFLSKKTRRRRRRAPSEEPQSLSEEDPEQPALKKTRRKKEQAQYKSAQFIEDSDAELGDDEEFFKKEAALRERAALSAADEIHAGMKPSGTKKRKSTARSGDKGKKRRKNSTGEETRSEGLGRMKDSSESDGSESSETEEIIELGRSDKFSAELTSRPRPKPRPRARPSYRQETQAPQSESVVTDGLTHSPDTSKENVPVQKEPLFINGDDSDTNSDAPIPNKATNRRRIIAVSDDEL
ncbi:hypothetical protein Clacol_008985 [Clathrus columnatus]|uniref:PCI domain-containing protein n=1 Tax=Clathrus columnatus TaxID=1419009 RepID=A0AAV5AMI9_9AGAM|nr:hypothetical protein Clacol_008985 [Clathrus columnatus]